jgi:hypothetical protein
MPKRISKTPRDPSHLSDFDVHQIKLETGHDVDDPATFGGMLDIWRLPVCCVCGQHKIIETIRMGWNIPASREGHVKTYRNAIPLCEECSREKGDKTLIEFHHWRAIRQLLRDTIGTGKGDRDRFLADDPPPFQAPSYAPNITRIDLFSPSITYAVYSYDKRQWGTPSVFRLLDLTNTPVAKITSRVKFDDSHWFIEWKGGPLRAYYRMKQDRRWK